MNRLEAHTLLTYFENVINRSHELQLEMLELWRTALSMEVAQRLPQKMPERVEADEGPRAKGKTAYSVAEAAELLGVSRSIAYTAIQRGDLPSLRIGRRILVPRDALEQMLA